MKLKASHEISPEFPSQKRSWLNSVSASLSLSPFFARTGPPRTEGGVPASRPPVQGPRSAPPPSRSRRLHPPPRQPAPDPARLAAANRRPPYWASGQGPNERRPLKGLGHMSEQDGGAHEEGVRREEPCCRRRERLGLGEAAGQCPLVRLKDFEMTEREFLESGSPQQRLILERFKRMELIQKMFNELPKSDQNLCNHGKFFLAANSSLCGLAANNFFRSILLVRKAALVSAVPMAVIPFLSTAAVYEVFVHDPLFSGQLNCEVCAVVRGGLVGAVVGGLYPIFLAIPLNASLAARYMSTPLPGKENLLRYWRTTAQPVFRKMSLGILIQALTGLYLATKQHGIYFNILLQMNTSRDPEELPE